MNSLVLLAALTIGEFRSEDLYYYDDAHQPQGVVLQNKFFIDTNGGGWNKDKFEKFMKNFPKIKDIKEVEKEDYRGVFLNFEKKHECFTVLNEFTKEYGEIVRPVVKFDGLDVIAVNQIIVKLKPSVNANDYVKRLDKMADGKFRIAERANNNIYIIEVKDLKNPDNIFNLANLVAQDTFWTESAMVHWLPVEGYVNGSMVVESASMADLGHDRVLKLIINVYHKAKVRLDLLPILGQGLQPFPFAGEIWFDSGPYKITQEEGQYKTVITVEYPFKYLQFGNFLFNPVEITYEVSGKRAVTNTESCRFFIGSVTNGMNIFDIQAAKDRTKVKFATPLPEVVPNKMIGTYRIVKWLGLGLFGGGTFLLLVGIYATVIPLVKRYVNKQCSVQDKVWRNLQKCVKLSFDLNWKPHYMEVNTMLNKVLTQEFNVSVYNLNPATCNYNFRLLLSELSKLYMVEGVTPESDTLIQCLNKFCAERKYD